MEADVATPNGSRRKKTSVKLRKDIECKELKILCDRREVDGFLSAYLENRKGCFQYVWDGIKSPTTHSQNLAWLKFEPTLSFSVVTVAVRSSAYWNQINQPF